jgi:hypothetical protein
MDSTNNSGWVVIVYKLPTHPSRIRVAVWRKLKKYGALYYQQGVAMLPKSEHFLELMRDLKSEIASFGGEAVLAELNFMEERDKKNAIEEFNAGLSREYLDIRETGSKIWNDIEIGRKSNLLNLAFLEERLARLKKLRKAYEIIAQRDCFKVRLRERIEEHIENVQQKVQLYYSEFKNAAKPIE